MKKEVNMKWKTQRKDIIERQLHRKKKEKLMRLVFLKFMENVLIEKKKAMVIATV